MPANLMDDYVPVSPGVVQDEEVEDAGWGEVSHTEAKKVEDNDEDEDGGKVAMVDLDAIAQEVDVWGQKEDDD